MKIEASHLQNLVIFLGGHAGNPSAVQNVLHVLYNLVPFLFYDQCTVFQLETPLCGGRI
jgi:hypothetical protein